MTMTKYDRALTETRSVLEEWMGLLERGERVDSMHSRNVLAERIVQRLVAKGVIQSTDQDDLQQYRTGPLAPGRTVTGGPTRCRRRPLEPTPGEAPGGLPRLRDVPEGRPVSGYDRARTGIRRLAASSLRPRGPGLRSLRAGGSVPPAAQRWSVVVSETGEVDDTLRRSVEAMLWVRARFQEAKDRAAAWEPRPAPTR